MSTATMSTRQVFEEYLNALSGKPKTVEGTKQYVSDPELIEHIRECEAGFPLYSIDVHEMLVDGDKVAVRGTFHGTHKGEFAGVAPTGRTVSADLMLFYLLEDGKISKFWMQADMAGLIGQLSA